MDILKANSCVVKLATRGVGMEKTVPGLYNPALCISFLTQRVPFFFPFSLNAFSHFLVLSLWRLMKFVLMGRQWLSAPKGDFYFKKL